MRLPLNEEINKFLADLVPGVVLIHHIFPKLKTDCWALSLIPERPVIFIPMGRFPKQLSFDLENQPANI